MRKSTSGRSEGLHSQTLGQVLYHVNRDSEVNSNGPRGYLNRLPGPWGIRGGYLSVVQAMREGWFSRHHHDSLSLCRLWGV